MNKYILLLVLVCSSFVFSEDYFYSREWINLLYYEKSGSEYKSMVEGDNFFISEQGKTNPKEEYEASLLLVLANDVAFKQRFPLRYKLIAKHNNLKYAPTIQVSSNIRDVIVAYPNRYMNNPASMFGHLFLILETNMGILDSDILHYIANTDGDRSLSYIVKGLTGQYKGVFLREPYYKKIKGYNYVEDRDIIYYNLKLSPDQIENIQLHYIEVKNNFFYYYFLDKNCAFFIGKLLNIVLTDDIKTKGLYILPSQIINDLFDDKLLENEGIRVANTKLFNKIFNQLTDEQKKQVNLLFKENLESPEADPEVLKAFILISEYVISNHSSLAEIIRFNRISAYKKLKDLKVSNIRQSIQNKGTVKRIQAESIGLALSFDKSYEASFSPINFSEYDNFNKLEIISVKCLETKINLQPNNSLQFTLSLLDLNNITQYNEVLNSFSWRIRSSFAYKNNVLTNQEAYYGFGLNVINRGLLYSLLGLNYTNFDNISELELGSYKFIPTIQLGLNYNWAENLKSFVLYENKFENDYLTTGIIYKQGNLINNITLINNRANTSLRISVEYLF